MSLYNLKNLYLGQVIGLRTSNQNQNVETQSTEIYKNSSVR